MLRAEIDACGLPGASGRRSRGEGRGPLLRSPSSPRPRGRAAPARAVAGPDIRRGAGSGSCEAAAARHRQQALDSATSTRCSSAAMIRVDAPLQPLALLQRQRARARACRGAGPRLRALHQRQYAQATRQAPAHDLRRAGHAGQTPDRPRRRASPTLPLAISPSPTERLTLVGFRAGRRRAPDDQRGRGHGPGQPSARLARRPRRQDGARAQGVAATTTACVR